MSGYIAGAVWNTTLPERGMKMVLASIADNANDEGFAWPSVDTIGVRCMLSKRAVLRALQGLEAGGWLQRCGHPNNSRRNAYQMELDKLQFGKPRASAKSAAVTRARSAPVGSGPDEPGTGAKSAPVEAAAQVPKTTPTGAKNDVRQVPKTTPIGAKNDSLYGRTVIEPSGEPSLEPRDASAATNALREEAPEEQATATATAKAPGNGNAGAARATTVSPGTQWDSEQRATATATAKATTWVNAGDESGRARRVRTEASAEELAIVYRAYPRREGEIAAMDAIRKAVALLVRGSDRPPMPLAEALMFLRDKASRFARSPAGQQGQHTPMPKTWFNDGRYFDNPEDWHRSANAINQGNQTTRLSASAQRQHESHDSIRAAVASILGEDPGDAYGANAGAISHPGSTRWNGEDSPDPMGADSPEVWDLGVSGRTIEAVC